MQKFGEFVCKHKRIILIIMLILLIPSIIGMKATRINYDILVYLPDDIETIQGENILSEDFNMGAFSIILLEDMETKDILKLEDEIKQVDNVAKVISGADVLGTSIPVEMLPDEVKDELYKDNTTVMLVTFKEAISSDATMNTVQHLRDITDKHCKISGMTATLLDTRDLSNSEVAIYVVIAVVLCFNSIRNSIRFLCCTNIIVSKYRNCNIIQYGNKYLFRRDIIYNKGNKCSITIRCNNGLCNILIS